MNQPSPLKVYAVYWTYSEGEYIIGLYTEEKHAWDYIHMYKDHYDGTLHVKMYYVDSHYPPEDIYEEDN